MDYMTISDAAAKWGISSRRVQILCASGRISGAERLGRSWAIQKTLKSLVTPGSKAENISVFPRSIERKRNVLPKVPKLLTAEGVRYADIR